MLDIDHAPTLRDLVECGRGRRLHRDGSAHAYSSVWVSKAYVTRVGAGLSRPRPRSGGDALRKVGNEFGAVNRRPGGVDGSTCRSCANRPMINGFDSLVVTKLDVLDGFAEIPVCTSYAPRRGRRDAASIRNWRIERSIE